MITMSIGVARTKSYCQRYSLWYASHTPTSQLWLTFELNALKARHEFPYLRRFACCWPVDEFAKKYIKRRRLYQKKKQLTRASALNRLRALRLEGDTGGVDVEEDMMASGGQAYA